MGVGGILYKPLGWLNGKVGFADKAPIHTVRTKVSFRKSGAGSLEDTRLRFLEDPMHPDEALKELYLNPREVGADACAGRLGMPRTRIERLIIVTTGITPDAALRIPLCYTRPRPIG